MKKPGKKENKGSGKEESRLDSESSGATEQSPGDESEASGAEISADAACREENYMLRDQLSRLAADFDNFRKRSARQMEEYRKTVLEKVLLDFLEVSDNFERALKSSRSTEDMASVINGLEQLSRQFDSVLEKHGLEKIECEKAVEFDPYKHEAVQHVETLEIPDNTVFQVYKSGYALDSKVIRPAMVSVARNPGDEEPKEE
ncbi:nucleotide exchange factor GrpE [Methanosarcina sp. Mfa9]|uniref:nucleotide exchange factor GrpE n=1 Tax=Methanosarcina sp. Mfa9 TaxID=3439063 RepID=UPI003F84C4AE